MHEQEPQEEEFSLKRLFVPFTNTKAITFIILAGVFAYANILINGFVWDDGGQLAGNVYVQTGNYFYYFTHTIGPYYKPLMFFFYTLIFQIFNLNSFAYHLFQIILHISNSILLFLLLSKFSKKKRIAFLLSLLFLLYPINEESVAYIADYQDVLFLFFGLFSMLTMSNRWFGKYSTYITAIFLL